MLGDLLTTIDLIGIPVTMNLFGREKAKTRFGGLCSVLFSCFISWAIYNAGQELFSTLNPKIVSSELYKSDPRAITLTRESFPIGFAMLTPDALGSSLFKDESIFTIEVSHIMIRRTAQNSEDWKISKVYTENCKADHFGDHISGASNFDLDSIYCISEHQPELDKLEIQGVYSSPIYQAIVAEVFACDNSTSSVTCASPEKINQYLSGSWFNTVYVNMVVDSKNYSNPNNTYKDIYYTMVNPANYRETEIDLGYVEVSTDSGWLTESINTKSYIKVNKINEFLNTTPHPRKVLIHCTLKVSQVEAYHTRSYKKLQGVLAEIGGMANTALVFLIISTTPFMRLKFRESLMNELFDIQIPERQDSKKKCKPKSRNQKKNHSSGKEIRETDQYIETHEIPLGRLTSQIETHQDYRQLDTIRPMSPLSEERIVDRVEKEPNIPSSRSPRKLLSFSFQFRAEDRESEEADEVELAQKDSDSNKLKLSKTYQDILSKVGPIDDLGAKNVKNLESPIDKSKKPIAEQKHTKQQRKLILKTNPSKPKMKSLHDENSLHLSFSSKSNDESDLELSEASKDYQEIQIKQPDKIEENKQDNHKQEKEKLDVEEAPSPTDKNTINEESDTTVNKKLNISIWDYICWFVCKSGPLKEQKEIYAEGLQNINERLDIINIMKKLREVDKLRALLLDADQLILFNNMPNPVIHSKNVLQRKLSGALGTLQDAKFVEDKASIEQIITSIHNINGKKVKTEIDKKLIKVFLTNNR